ncbi:hypothetical protein CLAFUW4_11883 [Fulvia fulva]|nr:hypothetical protein CLAFUR4_11888 [Fulvia fulva]WPV18581.1 hypothetical protein CLAFUW4_11883 [Fulvia fulva]WPV33449.1 hypothetical protein CLAFUW7_11890 [Fulvia fulva]
MSSYNKHSHFSGYDDTPCTCPPCTAIVEKDDSLESRSRLRDDDFYTANPAGKVCLPSQTQRYYLRKAYSLAQGALWHALRDHWPRAQRQYYLEEPDQVRFGNSELEHCFGNSYCPSQQNGMCGLPPAITLATIYSVIDLRNAVCHPTPGVTQHIDRLMQRAQDLTVTLLDETRAMRVRRLRDDIQKDATRGLDDIAALEPLSWLPDTTSWALHHQIYFQQILTDLKRGDNSFGPSSVKHDPAAVRAARSWGMRCSSPREDDSRYVAVMAKKAAYVREACEGRRASVCAMLGAREQADDVVPAKRPLMCWLTQALRHYFNPSGLVTGTELLKMRLDTLSATSLLLGIGLAAPPSGNTGGSSNTPGGNLPLRPAAGSSKAASNAKQIKLGDIFDVLVDNSRDSCAKYYDPKAEPGKSEKHLNQYWDQVYTFTTSAEAAVEDKYTSNAEKRKLMQLYFGIEMSEKGVATKGIESLAFGKVQGDKKPRLACGSSFQIFQESNDPMKDENGEDTKPNIYRFMQDQGLQWHDYWVHWDKLDKSYNVMPRREDEKEAWGGDPDAVPYPPDPDDETLFHICNHPEVSAQTLGAGDPLPTSASEWQKRTHRKRGLVILCPETFQAMPDAVPPITKQKLDTGAHAVGTELATMGTNALALYHELFHLVMEGQVISDKARLTEDFPPYGADVDQNMRLPKGFPAKKDTFISQPGSALGPIQCGYIALFDKAEPRAAKLEDYFSTMSPEHYAWFGLTSAMHDHDKMDWSSGVTQKAGGPFKGVFTSRDDYRKDIYVPINTCQPQDDSE